MRRRTARATAAMRRLAGRVSLLGVFAAANPVAAPLPSPVLHVESGPRGNLAVEARHVMLKDALPEVAERLGFETVVAPAAGDIRLDISIERAPVEEVLRQLLRGTSYAFVYRGSGGALSRVVVLSPNPVRPAARERPGRGPARQGAVRGRRPMP